MNNLIDYPIEDVISMCQENNDLNELCQRSSTWKYFLERDYPHFVLRNGEDPQECYRKIYSNKYVKRYEMNPNETFDDLRFHQNIKSLNCSYNRLTSLEGCPLTITELDCSVCNLVSLQGCPPSVVILNCHSNKLTSLQGCSPSVVRLYCSDNQLDRLNDCPDSVKELDCSHNRITSLRGCPSSVSHLNCSYNYLISLEGCPYSIISLDCSYNLITSLNVYLPNLREIHIHGNNIHLTEREAVIKLNHGSN